MKDKMMNEAKVGDTIKITGMYRDVYKNQTLKVIRIRKSRIKSLLDILFFIDPYNTESEMQESRYNTEKVLS